MTNILRARPPRFVKATLIPASIVLASIFVALLLFEVYFRSNIVDRLEQHFSVSFYWVQSNPLQFADKYAAKINEFFRREPNFHPKGLFQTNSQIDISVIPIDTRVVKAPPLNFSVRTNNLGMLSKYQYAIPRSENEREYRIVVLGDSFTGMTTATHQWVDSLQDLLNMNNDLLSLLNVDRIRTYNLGVIAAGFPTFPIVFERSGRFFDPDLIIVNIIEYNFPRTTSAFTSEFQYLIEDEQAMTENARRHLSKLVQLANGKPVLILTTPMHHELVSRDQPLRYTSLLVDEMEEHKIVDMRRYIPVLDEKSEYASWFNFPHDAHFSDRGSEIYARAVAAVVTEVSAGQHTNYMAYKTPLSDAVFGESKPRTRLVETSTSYFVKDRELLDHIFRRTVDRMASARRWRLRPWFLDVLFGTGNDGIAIPYGEGIVGDFIPFKYGGGSTDVAYMNILCADQPTALSNPDCYTHFHLYVDEIGERRTKH